MRKSRRALSVLAVTAVCALAAAASAAAYAPYGSFVLANVASVLTPEASPPGANVGCRPTTAHPYPVVLVHGTFENMLDNWGAMSAYLANAGYCVYALNYGGVTGSAIKGTGPASASAQQLASFVQQVKAASGAAKVDLVGHSQGGMLSEYYAKVLHGAPNVHAIVGLSPTTHGTTLDGITTLAGLIPGASALLGAGLGAVCQACVDQNVGSPMIAALDNGPIAQAGVKYTIIETRNETVVTPVGSAFVNEPGVTNKYVQSDCLLDLVDHINLPYDRVVIRETMNALDPAHAKAPNCLLAFPTPA